MDLESRKNELGLLLNLEVRARWLEEWLDITVCGSVLSVQFFFTIFIFYYTAYTVCTVCGVYVFTVCVRCFYYQMFKFYVGLYGSKHYHMGLKVLSGDLLLNFHKVS